MSVLTISAAWAYQIEADGGGGRLGNARGTRLHSCRSQSRYRFRRRQVYKPNDAAIAVAVMECVTGAGMKSGFASVCVYSVLVWLCVGVLACVCL